MNAWSLRPPLSLALFAFCVLFLVFPLAHPLVFAPQNPGAYLGFATSIMMLGSLAVNTARSIISHPLCYTLPAVQGTMRRNLLHIGVAGSVLMGAFLFFYPAAGTGARIQAMAGGFFAALSLYFATTLVILRYPMGRGIVQLWILTGSLSQLRESELRVAIMRAVTDHPVVCALASAILFAAFWQLFARRDLGRQLVERGNLSHPFDANARQATEQSTVWLTQMREKEGIAREGWFSALLPVPGAGSPGLSCFRHQLSRALAKYQVWLGTVRLWAVFAGGSALLIAARTETVFKYTVVIALLFGSFTFVGAQRIAPVRPWLPYRRRDLAVATVLMGLVVNLALVAGGALLYLLYWLADLIYVDRQLADLLWVKPDEDASVAVYLAFSSLVVPIYLAIKLFRQNWMDSAGALLSVAFVFAMAPLSNMFFDDYSAASLEIRAALHLTLWALFAVVSFWHFRTRDLY